jgi:hypothetical protein
VLQRLPRLPIDTFLLVPAATFVAFPLLGLAVHALVPSVLTPGLC